MRLLHVAAAAVNQLPLDWDGNLARIRAAMATARARGARLLVLPTSLFDRLLSEPAFRQFVFSLFAFAGNFFFGLLCGKAGFTELSKDFCHSANFIPVSILDFGRKIAVGNLAHPVNHAQKTLDQVATHIKQHDQKRYQQNRNPDDRNDLLIPFNL